MNKTVRLKKTTLFTNLTRVAAAISLALFVNCTAHAESGVVPASGQNHLFTQGSSDTIHSILVSRSQTSKKHKVRLYPDARQQVLFFSANGEDGRVYQLFLFDMDGRLVSQSHIRNKETTVLTNMSEGNFLFEVFTDDERIENGQVTVR
jgi:hypothetical protein